MNRINKLFDDKTRGVLSVYFTAGYPKLSDTAMICESLERAGADIIEVGMPFSDPIADGPTIQESNKSALDNGISLKLIFDQLADIRKRVQIPIVLMGYINPVLQFGLEAFCSECASVGIDGLILPDLPMQEYLDEYKPTFQKYGLLNIFLITPQTSEQRIWQIDRQSDGFIYVVSSASTTGAKSGISQEQDEYFQRINDMHLKNPMLIGFGISDHDSFQHACRYADGAIIGSAFINVLTRAKNLTEEITTFINDIKRER
jgi:tryptophan synthase alpha chain